MREKQGLEGEHHSILRTNHPGKLGDCATERGRTPEEAQAELVNVFELIKEEYEEKGKLLPQDVDLREVHACQSQRPGTGGEKAGISKSEEEFRKLLESNDSDAPRCKHAGHARRRRRLTSVTALIL
jgi:hypothetical protein